MFISDRLWKQFGDLTHQVKTGGHTQTLATGAEGFLKLQSDPPRLHAFQMAMAESSIVATREAMKTWDFGRFERVLDLGGGYGGVLAELLRTYPQQTGAVFDLPFLKDEAGGLSAGRRRGQARAEFLGGNFLRGRAGWLRPDRDEVHRPRLGRPGGPGVILKTVARRRRSD